MLEQSGWVPFACAIGAMMFVAVAGLTWVTSPYWGRGNVQAPARNVGVVPMDGGGVGRVAFNVLLSPNRVEIPKLQAEAPIVRVGTTPDNELEIPLDPKVVGWWENGAKPGATKGTAILDGHINFNGVDGVLSHIGTLNPGDTVYVIGINAGKHTKLRFTITGVRTYNKHVLPYAEIFDQKSVGRLAIVTCGGSFDPSTGKIGRAHV